MAKFNESTTTQILNHMRAGTSFERAAQSAGVDRVTLWRWLRQGESDASNGKRTRHAQFASDFARADAEVVGQVERWIVTQAEMDPRAAVWFLSKRAPKQYGNEDAAVRHALAQQVVAEFLEFVERHISKAAFDEVLAALGSFGDTELDPQALPVPG